MVGRGGTGVHTDARGAYVAGNASQGQRCGLGRRATADKLVARNASRRCVKRDVSAGLARERRKLVEVGNERVGVTGGAATRLTFLRGALSYSEVEYGHEKTTGRQFFC